MATTPNVNYVKFQRGTTAAYNVQKNANKINNDTLYFVYENASSTTGSLYLGTKLISGGVNSTVPESLTTLATVLDGASANSFLIKTSSGWESIGLDDLKDLLDVSAGGDTLGIDSNQFVKVEDSLSLLGFNDASNGQILTKVDGKVSWTTPIDLSARVGSLETAVNGIGTQISTAIANANHLTYVKKESLAAAQTDAKENVIYLIPASTSGTNDIYDEYMYVDNSFEKIGSVADVNLEGYITSSAFNTAIAGLATKTELSAVDAKFDSYVTTVSFNNSVGSINDSISEISGVIGSISDFYSYEDGVTNTIIDELNILDQRLTWGIIPSE